ncbi:MAG: exosortase system-associated protein, TIGR04073 family [Candidatus Omnitrophica bacterium]|nr:exosortase system-associated protein, TIGR04073 family [Candidatus Omnitrophota bacterium]
MIKGMLCILLIAALVVSAAGVSYAAGAEELFSGMGKKLVRGVVNTVTGWVEIPTQIYYGYKSENFGGAFVGIFSGIWHGIGRTVSGAGDVVGFWAADPKSNDGVGIPLNAEYAWEEGTKYDLMKPSFGEATLTPMGNKLGRGLGNSLLGFVELPGQVLKGLKLHAPDLGVVKGLWYWYSRQIDGAVDVASFLFPNPKDTKALAFDEKWPWSALGDTLKK